MDCPGNPCTGIAIDAFGPPHVIDPGRPSGPAALSMIAPANGPGLNGLSPVSGGEAEFARDQPRDVDPRRGGLD